MVKKKQKIIYDSLEEDKKNEKVVYDSYDERKKNQKVVYDLYGSTNDSVDGAQVDHRRLQEVSNDELKHNQVELDADRDVKMGEKFPRGVFADDLKLDDLNDGREENEEDHDLFDVGEDGDGDFNLKDDIINLRHDDYSRYDDYPRYDDFFSGRYSALHDEYFDDKHYVRLPPHILSTPVIAEMPKLYSDNGETENLLFLAVSYYFDEDEYDGFFSYKRFEDRDHGDETETQRGMFVANAIMIFHLGDNPRWGRQEHLDLSTDHSAPVNLTLVSSIPLKEDNSKLGAFALSTPTIADIDGDGSAELLMGTSMGFLYVMDARNLYVKDKWPIQLQFGIEFRVLVEDVQGDTNLEIFVVDVGGNVFCLDHTGKKIWHRNLPHAIDDGTNGENREIVGSSPLVLGDVNGDGVLDVVILLQIKDRGKVLDFFLFAIDATNGKTLEGQSFPMNIWKKADNKFNNVGEDFIVAKFPPPLLVDLHGNQDHIADYIRRKETKWISRESKQNKMDETKLLQGGSAAGLHVVQPIGTYLLIVEGGSGCTQSIEIGEQIDAAIQVDDVHGTNKLDLVISTASGNVITIKSEAPFHPLNVWNSGSGEVRSRTNAAAHGYSSSQGIFVHERSRRYRDIFGVYVPLTFEIFDNRPNVQNEPDKRMYMVDIKVSTSLLVFRKKYDSMGVYTERLYIPYGPGYYELSVILKTSHGLFYEDSFHIGYNVNYMSGFSVLLWLPLTIATVFIFLMGAKNHNLKWDEEDFESNGKGILVSRYLPE